MVDQNGKPVKGPYTKTETACMCWDSRLANASPNASPRKDVKTNAKGYLQFRAVDGTWKYAHVVIATMLFGRRYVAKGRARRGKPKKRKEVLHSCHNKACLSPLHLRWGWHRENMSDHSRRIRNLYWTPSYDAHALGPPKKEHYSGAAPTC